MTAVTQNSVIILRDDEQADLPGAPLTLAPLVFSPALTPGEVVFTRDTARMFVGHDPAVGQVNFRRTAFPYQNVEVLTENSVDTFNNMVGAYRRDEGDASFYYAVLPASATLTPIILPLPGAPTNQFRIDNVSSIAASMEYAGFNSDGKPVKMGSLRLMYGTGVAIPTCIDNGTDLGAPLLTFSAEIDGPVGSQYMLVNYAYTGTGNVTIRFRLTRPTFVTAI